MKPKPTVKEKRIEQILLSVIRPYTKDFQVWNKEWAKREKGEELSIADAIDKLLTLLK